MTPLAPPLSEFLAELTKGPAHGAPADESWPDHVRRISQPGQVQTITEEAFDFWLRVLPPRWLYFPYFCQAEGEEAFRLFWRRDDHHYGRQLANAETLRFCRLARIPPPLIAPESHRRR